MTSIAPRHTTALYIHIPWCVRKCPYCDFNSHLADKTIPEKDYVEALLTELEQRQQVFEIDEFSTVFIGGGTPSLFSPASIATLLEGAQTRVGLAATAEITLEANPGTADSSRFRGYHDAGVNRLSIGVQSFTDHHLQALGRIHDAHGAREAVEAAKTAGFTRLNLDLMYGLPGQTADQCAADLDQAIALSPSHLSLYQLTIEPHTRFHTRPPQLPADETIATMERHLLTTVQTAGYERYEVSAYALPGECCLHNLNYWQFGDYLGLGAGAHSKLTSDQTRHRLWNCKRPANYIKRVQTQDSLSGRSVLQTSDLITEYAMNALRLTGGFQVKAFTAATGLPESCLHGPVREGIQRGWLISDGSRIKTTTTGYRLLDSVLELF